MPPATNNRSNKVFVINLAEGGSVENYRGRPYKARCFHRPRPAREEKGSVLPNHRRRFDGNGFGHIKEVLPKDPHQRSFDMLKTSPSGR